ncbi:hypothetical protein Tco_1532768 [Tanacetum coccineum]
MSALLLCSGRLLVLVLQLQIGYGYRQARMPLVESIMDAPWFICDRRIGLFHRLSSKVKDLLEGVLYITWWNVWMFRNQLLFSSKAPRKDVIFDDIVSRSFTCGTGLWGGSDDVGWWQGDFRGSEDGDVVAMMWGDGVVMLWEVWMVLCGGAVVAMVCDSGGSGDGGEWGLGASGW